MIDHRMRERGGARHRTRRSRDRTMRAGVMIANMPWNIAKTSSGTPVGTAPTVSPEVRILFQPAGVVMLPLSSFTGGLVRALRQTRFLSKAMMLLVASIFLPGFAG